MYRSFYQFILTYVDPYKKDMHTCFANVVSEDIGFPKHSDQYDEIVNYIELTDIYSQYIQNFDELWEVYKELCTK
ncbi:MULTISPECIES: YozE family protein [unclassified Granulicatella]|uniref:YozE family protein n=1 Tax=unclassified Granulicatella TaxID=2630493 RepID=UPI0010736883|nr:MULTISPECIES: YozE family protein [unclassified Granulicatella]MBF0780573.1 YozE family protein [Granulicatella sp. 19428wC4_WM01]TFU94924.1 YozE family protein [Granulicatella sp. WM01]